MLAALRTRTSQGAVRMLAPRRRVVAAGLAGLLLIAVVGCASPWSWEAQGEGPPTEAADDTATGPADDPEPTDAEPPASGPEPQAPDREVAARLRRDLSSPQATARIAALAKLVEQPPAALPAEVVEARFDADPRVRARALEVVAAVGSADALALLARGLRDESRDVRHAAMRGLGRLDDDEARNRLRDLWKQEPETTRVVLVEALASAGDLETLLAAAEDKVWQVRAAAAPAIARQGHDARAVAALERLAADASSVVQSAAVEAVADWPIDAAGAVWLTAMEQGGTRARLAAQKAMAKTWPAAAGFDPEADRDVRIRQLVEVRGQFQASRAAGLTKPPRGEVSTGRDELSPQAAEALKQMAADSVDTRRLGGQTLAAAARRGPLGPAACQRLAELLPRETDAAVWRSALDALSGDASTEATQVALLAAGHDEGDIRRRACSYFAAHPTPEAAPQLAALLEDREITVERSAAEALGRCAGPAECEALTRALGARDGPLRVAAAESLANLRHESGLPALERLARDADLNVRLAAVRAMGQLADPAAQGALVDLLDEPHGVGVAALRALRKSALDETTGAAPVQPGSQPAEVAEWKRWWRERPAKP